MKIWTLFIFAIFVLAGCTLVSVPVPTPKQNTLLVGKLLVSGNGFDTYGTTVYIKSHQTGNIFSVTTQKDGWLFTNKLDGGNYTILYIEKEPVGMKYKMFKMILNGPFYITIEDDLVNNIGVIKIYIENVIGNVYFSPRLLGYDVVKLNFQSEFPDSEWNSYEWKNKEIMK